MQQNKVETDCPNYFAKPMKMNKVDLEQVK